MPYTILITKSDRIVVDVLDSYWPQIPFTFEEKYKFTSHKMSL